MFAFLSGAFPSSTTETVDDAMFFIVAVSVILLIGITAVMIFFVFKYHRKKGHKPVDIHGNIWLEIIWIGIPTILVMAMFYYGYLGFSSIRNIPDNAFEIKVNARMWSWQFDYPNGKQTDSLYIPIGQPIKLSMISADVNHSLFIPAFRIKEDLVAGRTTYLSFVGEKIGRYDIECAEYCGLKHSMMYSAVFVMSEKDFAEWYADSTKTDSTQVLKEEVSSLSIGDKWEVVIKNDYSIASIQNPDDDIVKSYAVGMMPSQKFNLSDEEFINAIESSKSIN